MDVFCAFLCASKDSHVLAFVLERLLEAKAAETQSNATASDAPEPEEAKAGQ